MHKTLTKGVVEHFYGKGVLTPLDGKKCDDILGWSNVKSHLLIDNCIVDNSAWPNA